MMLQTRRLTFLTSMIVLVACGNGNHVTPDAAMIPPDTGPVLPQCSDGKDNEALVDLFQRALGDQVRDLIDHAVEIERHRFTS